MSYFSVSRPNDKTQLNILNDQLIQAFKLRDDITEISVYPPSFIPNRVAQENPIKYQKEIHPALPSVAIIKKNGKYDGFIWRPSKDHALKLANYGFLKTHSLTGGVISALGRYHSVMFAQIQDGYIGNRFREKKALLHVFQSRIEGLLVLESLANQPNSAIEVKEKINEYINYIKYKKLRLKKYFDDSQFLAISPNVIEQMAEKMDEDIQLAEEYKSRVHLNLNEVNQSSGANSIVTFVKSQLRRHLSEMQNINQDITYSAKPGFALSRGELNNCIEDAKHIIDNAAFVPNDSFGREHHGHYYDPEFDFVYDSNHHELNSKDEHDLLLAISFIEKANQVDFTDPDSPRLKTKDGGSFPLRVVSAVKWQTNGITGALKSFSLLVLNIVGKFFFGLIELPLTLFIEPLTFGYFQNFFDSVRRGATHTWTIHNANAPLLSGRDLFREAALSTTSFGLRVRELAKNLFRNTFRDVIYGIRDVYQHFTIRLFDDVYNDWVEGGPTPNFYQLELLINSQLQEIHNYDSDSKSRIYKKFHAELNPALRYDNLYEKTNKKFMYPSFVPVTNDTNDLFNSLADAQYQILHFFTDNIHAKHPFAGLLFSSIYTAGGLAVLSPDKVAFLGKDYLAFSQALGYGMSHSSLTAAISSASTQAQISSALYEFLLHGPSSWVGHAAKRFEKDPFNAVIYGGAAVGLGYVLAHMVDIPFFSHYLREEAGKYPAASLGVTGAKVGFLVVELLADHKLNKSIAVQKINTFVKEAYKQIQFDPTPAEVSKKSNDILLAMSKIIETCYNPVFIRAHIVLFLVHHQARLAYLSSEMKHRLVQQFRKHFSPIEARSLRKLLFPHENTSLLRTTLGIFLRYLAFIPRFIAAAFLLSPMCKNTKPFINAYRDFKFKLEQDIARVFRVICRLSKAVSDFFIVHLKVIADVIFNSILARIESLITGDNSIAHFNYKLAAKFDIFIERLMQFFSSPADKLIKSVTSAHPIDTQNKIMAMYINLLQREDNKPIKPISAVSTKNVSHSPKGWLIDQIHGQLGLPNSEATAMTSPVPNYSPPSIDYPPKVK